MYASRRISFKPAVLLLILASLLLGACSGAVGSTDWPGLSASGDIVYVADGSAVEAVNMETRQRVWQFPAEAAGSLQFFAAPEIAEDALFFGDYGASGGFFSPSVIVSIYAFDTTNGLPTELWVNDSAASDRIIAPVARAGNQLFVTTADNNVIALDAGSGTRQWSYPTGQSIWAAPTVSDGVVYAASLDGSVYALSATPPDETGLLLWQKDLGAALPGSITIGDGLVYAGGFGSTMYALDAGSGDVVWEVPAEDWIWNGAVLLDDRIIFADVAGNVYALDAATGRSLWMTAAGGQVKARPVLHEGVLYVVTIDDSERTPISGQLLAMDPGDGSISWQVTTPAPVFSTPVIVGNTLVAAVQNYDSQLLIYDLDGGALLWEYAAEN